MFSEKITELLTKMDNDQQLYATFLGYLEILTKQYCRERIERVASGRKHSRMYATMFTRPCERQGAFSYHQVKEDSPAQGRFKMNMWGGQQYEHIVLAALLTLDYDLQVQPYSYIPEWVYDDGKGVGVVADGLVTLTDNQVDEFYTEFGVLPKGNRVIIEIKSAGEKTYTIMRDDGLQDGYSDQTQLEMVANGCDVAIAIAVCRSKGYVHDAIVQKDNHDLARLTNLFVKTRDSKTPFDVETKQTVVPEMQYQKGKNAWSGSEDEYHAPRRNTKGYVYGWDIHTGKYKIPNWPCGYCGWAKTCWEKEGYKLELVVNNGYPTWIAEKV